MNIKGNKLKTAVMASILALSINFGISNEAHAINFNNFSLDKSFCTEISFGNPNSYSTSTNVYSCYLVYSPNDMTIYRRYDEYIQEAVGTLEGGKLYLVYNHANGGDYAHASLKGDGIYVPIDYGSGSSCNITSLGNAADIFGEGGMSEEDIKDLIEDAVHNVDGDQTVTGDQQVDGEQTVNGGQSVSGGFFHKKGRANNEKTI